MKTIFKGKHAENLSAKNYGSGFFIPANKHEKAILQPAFSYAKKNSNAKSENQMAQNQLKELELEYEQYYGA